MDLTQDDFTMWLQSHATQKVFDRLREYRKAYVDGLCDGRTLGHSADVTQAETARAVGVITGLDLVLNLKYAEEPIDGD